MSVECCKDAMVELFTLEEQRNSNYNGRQNKKKIDPLRLSTVRHACFKADPFALSKEDYNRKKECIKRLIHTITILNGTVKKTRKTKTKVCKKCVIMAHFIKFHTQNIKV